MSYDVFKNAMYGLADRTGFQCICYTDDCGRYTARFINGTMFRGNGTSKFLQVIDGNFKSRVSIDQITAAK